MLKDYGTNLLGSPTSSDFGTSLLNNNAPRDFGVSLNARGSTGMEPISAITAGASAVTAIGGLFGGKGGGQTETGLTLPPELEMKMLSAAYESMKQVEQDYIKADKMYTAYQTKFDTLAKGIEANVPAEQLRKDVAKQSAQIASKLGLAADDLLGSGFLSQDDLKDIQAMRDLESADLKDPIYEKQRADQRATLMQNLLRSGASPQAQAQALASFDNDTMLGSFSRTEELRASRQGLIANRLATTQGLRQSNFGLASSALTSQLGALDQWTGAQQAAGSMLGQGMAAGTAGLQTAAGLRDQRQGLFNQLGEYKFSGQAQNWLADRAAGTQGLRSGGNFASTTDRDLLRMSQQQTSKEAYKKKYGAGFNPAFRNNAVDEELKRRGLA